MRWADAISNRNFLIHQYDEIDREISWGTLSVDLAGWRRALTDLFARANDAIDRDELGAVLAAEAETVEAKEPGDPDEPLPPHVKVSRGRSPRTDQD